MNKENCRGGDSFFFGRRGDWRSGGEQVEISIFSATNGYSRFPHLHVGAWIGDSPLQIRFDLAAMGRQLRTLGERRYYI